MALGATKSKLLGIVPNEQHSMPGINRRRAEVALFNSHLMSVFSFCGSICDRYGVPSQSVCLLFEVVGG